MEQAYRTADCDIVEEALQRLPDSVRCVLLESFADLVLALEECKEDLTKGT
jgi:hypothetical protein